MMHVRTPIEHHLIELIEQLERMHVLNREEFARLLRADERPLLVGVEALGETNLQADAAVATPSDRPPRMSPLAISVKTAARVLGVGRNNVYEAIHRGEIPVLRLGGRMVVPLAALEMQLLQTLKKS